MVAHLWQVFCACQRVSFTVGPWKLKASGTLLAFNSSQKQQVIFCHLPSALLSVSANFPGSSNEIPYAFWIIPFLGYQRVHNFTHLSLIFYRRLASLQPSPWFSPLLIGLRLSRQSLVFQACSSVYWNPVKQCWNNLEGLGNVYFLRVVTALQK